MSAPVPRPWKLPPLLGASIALHAGALGLTLLRPATWPWVLGAVAADHALITAAGLWPGGPWLGPNWTRLPRGQGPRIAITIDDGPDPEVTPRVLDLLDRQGAAASFFCIGRCAAQHPDLVRDMVRRGHAVENHGQHHYHHFSLLGPVAMRREISAGQATLAAIAGQAPRFFRPTAGLGSPFLEPTLARLGLYRAGWTRRGYDTRVRDARYVASRLTRGLGPGDILLLHDGHAARTQAGRPVILEALPRVLDVARQAGLQAVTLRSQLADSA
jgi:peptidoglycan/xylan/chitin deacetylase (PgdA/CDA1 family)